MRAQVLAAAVAWLASAATAAAQPAFPDSLEREALLRWLQRETDITADSVVAVTPQVVTAIVSSFPAGGGQGPRVVIRAEALSAETYQRTGALSWHVSLTADCKGHQVKLGETTGYPERNLIGERRTLRPADADWRKPAPGTALDNAWRSACEQSFRGPLKEPTLKVVPPDPQAPLVRNETPPAKVLAASRPEPSPSGALVGASSPVAMAAAASRSASGRVVQVAAAPSMAEAQAVLASLAAQVGERETWVETATVEGKVWRRAVVGGFADAAEAAQFCAQLRNSGRACFVRATRRS